jgi:hypothetical protein
VISRELARRKNELDSFDESDPQRLETDARDFYANVLRNYSVAYSEMLRATGEDMIVSTTEAQRLMTSA